MMSGISRSIAGAVIVGLLATFVYREIQTRELLLQTQESVQNVAAELARLRSEVKASASQRNAGLEAKGGAKVRVRIYWHDAGLTEKDAEALSHALQSQGLTTEVRRHGDPQSPDAIFIGALVNAKDARLVLSSLPYNVEYIFRTDYPDKNGGDAEGTLVGVGYKSTHLKETAEERQIPRRISRDQILSLLEADLSNTEFQVRLRRMAGP